VTRRVIDSLDGPVVLVGHSYGGALSAEEIMNILEAYDLAGSLRDAGELAARFPVGLLRRRA
jgi:thioesterase domain-containing protein